jgi:phosphoribosylformylglycinamidine synthase
VTFQKEVVLDTNVDAMRALWEATSFEIEKLQSNPECVASESAVLAQRTRPQWTLKFNPQPTPSAILSAPVSQKPKVAVLRQEGSNGDREMVPEPLTLNPLPFTLYP